MAFQLIFFNVETTGLMWHDQIIYLSAYNDEDEFHAYMMPKVPIKPQASQVNGFEIHNGKLYENGNYVQHRNRNKALRSFLEYCEETAAGDQVVLVAHNGKCFAFNKLLQEIEEAGLDQDFERIVQGFCDTMPLFRNMFYDRIHLNRSFQLPKLHRDLVNEDHDNKPMMISDIFREYDVEANDVEDYTISWDDTYENYLELK